MYTCALLPALLALALQQGTTRTPPTSVVNPAPAPVALRRSPQPDILAAVWNTNTVVRFDGDSGDFEGTFTIGGPLRLPAGLDYGPDGNLYVSSFYWSTVLKYEGETGQYLGTFIDGGSSGLSQPSVLTFRPDGLLYVLASYNGGVLRYDAGTGAFHDVFIPSGSGGITTAFTMTFGPDGDIYLGGYYAKKVVRFDGQTGAFERVVAPFVDTPSGMAFGPDGMLYVGEWRSGSFFEHNIQRYRPTGGFLGQLTLLTQGPQDLHFDRSGRLYVAGRNGIDVLDGATGAWIDTMYEPGLQDLMAMVFMPGPRVRTR